MTDTPTDTAPEAIIQADREAAADSINEEKGRVTLGEEFIRKGEWDSHPRVVEMARHRCLNSHSAGEGLREAFNAGWECRSDYGLDRNSYEELRDAEWETGAARATPPSDAGSTTRSGGEGV